ncbi:hypothetical protein F4859DRAFT_436801 [Xylaria cf. heliscus]|nr:hypothetical protein F4859DRAFT_436801 [Xylaria cf. heliscus]
MSIGIRDLSDELVVHITKVLARRPEYGIAIPSRRWLQRQEEKMKHLPKELLRSSNLLKRLATKIADSIDPNIVDPRAILCKTHSNLNPFLIRRLFIALAYEVTVHTDALRSWPGRTLAPELSAFVGRLDSIAALWTEPRLFHEIYGLAPFDGHHVFVRSACEACCLAAVGASGRALADLRAALVDRMERHRELPSGREPRLYRVVEAWIGHLRKHGEGVGRPEECKALSDAVVSKLRTARPQIEAWRAEQKQRLSTLRAERRSVYTELRRTKTGARIAALPTTSRHKRRTRDGIPVALANVESAADQRRSAMYMNGTRSIYRPDSLSGYSEVYERQRTVRDLPPGPRSPAPERVRDSRTSNGLPTQSFLNRFEQEIPIDDEPGPYDLEVEQEEDERDYEQEERSRAKVQEWWSNILRESQLDLGQDDTRSVVTMVHPAFRPGGSYIAESALPDPLHVKKGRAPPTRTTEDGGTTVSAWTDCTVHTVGLSTVQPSIENIPSVPKIPSTYKHRGGSSEIGSKTPGASSRPPMSRTKTSSTVRNRQQSTISSRQHRDKATIRTNPKDPTPSSTKGKDAPLNWPAPPHGRRYPPTARDNPGPNRKVFLPSSDVDSTFSAQRHAFLMNRFKAKEGEPEQNSTVSHHSRRSQQGQRSRTSHDRTQTPVPTPPTQHTRAPPRPPSSVYDRDSISSVSSSVYDRHGMGSTSRTSGSGSTHDRYSVTSVSSGAWSPLETEVHEEVPNRVVPQPATVENWRDSRDGPSRRGPSLDAQTTASSVTQLGAFRGMM